MTPAVADRLAIATAERDRARAIAVSLEQQLARVEAEVSSWHKGLAIDDVHPMDPVARLLNSIEWALEADQ